MTDGIILIDKPANITSFGVVARVRRVLSEQQEGKEQPEQLATPVPGAMRKTVGVSHKRQRVKVGHCGTLDPFATGLLILCVGKECKNAGTYMKHDKVYEATFRLGQESTTGDPEGEITDYQNVVKFQGRTLEYPTRAEVERVLRRFTGDIQQRPPIFSALKIDGVRAYKLARGGQEVEIPLRTITIHSLELIDYTYPELKIRTHVSSGTYIRSLGVDIGKALGTGAYCTQLRRTAIAKWRVEQAKTLADFGIND